VEGKRVSYDTVKKLKRLLDTHYIIVDPTFVIFNFLSSFFHFVHDARSTVRGVTNDEKHIFLLVDNSLMYLREFVKDIFHLKQITKRISNAHPT